MELTATQQEAFDSLTRVQRFDANSLVRRDELGKYAFNAIVQPAHKLIEFFCSLPASSISYFPDQQASQIKEHANAAFSYFRTALDFDVASAQPNVADAQASIVANIENCYQSSFNILHPFIAFVSARTLDFAALDREARAASQSAMDHATEVVSQIEKSKEDVDRILSEIRAVSAEQGVSQKAFHFKIAADTHEVESEKWLKYSVRTAVSLGIFAFLSIFIHKIYFIRPESAYDAYQLIVSKVLIFATIAYMLIVSVKNFQSHKHNEIVNRHRQNALATYKTIVEATSTHESSDIVLSYAAACIFSPQDTGYAKAEAHSDPAGGVQIIPRIAQAAQQLQ